MQTGEPILGQIERGGVGGWVSITKAPPTDERGDIVGLVGINRIVTDVVRAQEALRDSEARRTQLLEQMLAVQEEERARISRELHDQVGQELTSVLIGLRVIESAKTPEDAIGQARALREVTSNTLEDVRQIAFTMRPSSLDDLGLATALSRDVETIGQNAGLEPTFKVHNPEDISLPTEMEVGIYRIVHTALTNVVRHADAHRVDVVMQTKRVRKACTVSVLVQDDGIGFDVDAVLAGPVEGSSVCSQCRNARGSWAGKWWSSPCLVRARPSLPRSRKTTGRTNRR
jgi:signal transduction histidine kinase